jgi:hypothetical protein
MQHLLLSLNVAALAVAVIFYTWRGYHGVLLRRERTIRERIALLLWAAAEQAE